MFVEVSIAGFVPTGFTVRRLFLFWMELIRGAQSLRSRGEDYARYQREVSAFFPWPPRRNP